MEKETRIVFSSASGGIWRRGNLQESGTIIPASERERATEGAVMSLDPLFGRVERARAQMYGKKGKPAFFLSPLAQKAVLYVTWPGWFEPPADRTG